ncbi:unnamed protein product, partial [Rhizoctonia solani]
TNKPSETLQDTEIDFETYMIHTDLYLAGERDYSKITGPTGPLVQVVDDVVEWLPPRNLMEGKIQELYAGLYLITMALTFLVYRRAGIPQYVLLLLPLSKRLHSIYVLRLFNLTTRRGEWYPRLAISIKMNVLLYMPAICLTLLLTNGLVLSLFYLSLTFSAVLIPSLTFLEYYPREYEQLRKLNSAVKKMFTWHLTSFVPEPTFLSAPFAKGLLVCHIALLGAFGFGAWCRKQGGALVVLERALQNPVKEAAVSSVTQDYIATVFFTANLIGILCRASNVMVKMSTIR